MQANHVLLDASAPKTAKVATGTAVRTMACMPRPEIVTMVIKYELILNLDSQNEGNGDYNDEHRFSLS